MSADNYMLVRQRGKWFYVSMQFADDEPTEIDPRYDRVFDNLEEATRYAQSEYTEYGISFDFEDEDK